MAFLVLVIAGCGGKGSAKLEGHWKGQSAEGVDGPAANSAAAFAVQTEIFAKGNQITISTPASKSTGTYTVESEDKTGLVIKPEKDAAETFTFTDANTMSWRVDQNRSIVFVRVKE